MKREIEINLRRSVSRNEAFFDYDGETFCLSINECMSTKDEHGNEVFKVNFSFGGKDHDIYRSGSYYARFGKDPKMKKKWIIKYGIVPMLVAESQLLQSKHAVIDAIKLYDVINGEDHKYKIAADAAFPDRFFVTIE